MENITTRIEGQWPFQSLIDPVYGPNSKYFWPGSRWDASYYASTRVEISPYVSGEEFLEKYEDDFSGVSDYLESTDYPDEVYCNALYDRFHRLYGRVKSWDRTSLFVSAVYRGIFDEMFPYESQLLELKTRLGYESTVELYLKEGKSEEEAMRAAYGESLKGVERGERSLSCGGVIDLILAFNTDLPLISELIKVLQRTNIVGNYQQQFKEGLLSRWKLFPVALVAEGTRQDLCREKLLLALSLLQIEPKAAERAVDESLSLQSYEPMIRVVRDLPSKRGFPSDKASIDRLGPGYTAIDYIRDLVLSEEAYDRVFEEIRSSASELRVTSVLMSFEEEGTKLAELAFSKMVQELYINQQNTPLLSIVNSATKSFEEDDLLLSKEAPLKKIFDQIGERINVPPEARSRILEICKRHGLPDNEALAEKMLSEASSTRGEGNTSERLVEAFAALLMVSMVFVAPIEAFAGSLLEPRTRMHTTELVWPGRRRRGGLAEFRPV